MGYIYKFWHEHPNGSLDMLYIGITYKNIKSRFNKHEHLPEDCYDKVNCIEYAEVESDDDLDILEDLLINWYKPSYNQRKKSRKNNGNFKIFDVEKIDNEILSWKYYNDSVKGQLKSKDLILF